MSASSMPLPYLVPNRSTAPAHLRPSQPRISPPKQVRRRPTMQQGQALEVLGHAIEYLVDSRMFLVHEPHTPGDADALAILARASREVFATCAEVVPVHQRFKQWAAERIRSGVLDTAAARRT